MQKPSRARAIAIAQVKDDQKLTLIRLGAIALFAMAALLAVPMLF